MAAIVVLAGIAGLVVLSEQRAPGSLSSSTKSSSSAQISISSSSQPQYSTSTQSPIQSGAPIPNTFTNAAEIFGNFSQLTMKSSASCEGTCSPDSSGFGTVTVSFEGSAEDYGFTYHEYNFTIYLAMGNQSQTSVEVISLNVSNPALSRFVLNGNSPGMINASVSTADTASIGSSPLPLFGSMTIEYGAPGLWFSGMPGEPKLVNQTNVVLGNARLSLNTYRTTIQALLPDPLNDQPVSGNSTLTATFATFQGTDITFCSAWVLQEAASDGSFTLTYTFSVSSLQRA